MLLVNNSIYQYIQTTPRRCIGYGVGTAIVGLSVFQRERVQNFNAIIVENSSPIYEKLKEYMSAVLRYNRNLCHSLYFKAQEHSGKVQFGLTAIVIGGLTVLAYKNQDKIIIVPASLVRFARYNLIALKNKITAH